MNRSYTRSPETLASPKYAQLAEQIKQQILSGELGINERLPSFVEMRAQYGATPTTVERVFATLEREGLIRREPRRGVFVCAASEHQGSSFKETRVQTGLIGFVGNFKVGDDLYSNQLMGGIQQALADVGKQMVLIDGQSTAGLEKIEGLLVCSTCLSEPVLRQLPPELPCVSLLVAMEDTSSVVSDDYQGAKDAIEHLIGLGHKRIGCLMEFALPLPRLRLAGYHDALTEAGLTLNPRWMRQVSRPRAVYTHWGREAMREWLQDGWRELGCTAILVQNDCAALGVIEALREAGVQVPEDVSVIGFDGTELCEYSTPRLTSVTVPLRQIGAEGAKILLNQIQKDSAAHQSIVFPTVLKERESVMAIS